LRSPARNTWVSRLASGKKHKVARQLCSRGIVRAVDDKVLFIFSRKVYPEIDPLPEKKIVDRLRAAIFEDQASLDPRTVVLISLANGAGLLTENFGRKEIKARKERIEQIVNGELTGKATKEVIAAAQAAIMVAAIMPTIMMTIMMTSSH
jgi:golgi phosphoprotein 3